MVVDGDHVEAVRAQLEAPAQVGLELERALTRRVPVIGVSLVLIFMIVYYRKSGVVADLGYEYIDATPEVRCAILTGAGLGFARAVGEFGSVVLISGNLPFKTEVAPLYVFQRLNSGDTEGAAGLAVEMRDGSV